MRKRSCLVNGGQNVVGNGGAGGGGGGGGGGGIGGDSESIYSHQSHGNRVYYIFYSTIFFPHQHKSI